MSVTPPLPPPPPSQPPGGAPDPGPRPSARPLNRTEERTLSRLEQELRRSYPDLESEMSSLESAGAGRGEAPGVPLDRILQAVAIGVIVLALVPKEWLAALLSIGLLLGIPFAMALIAVQAKWDGLGEDGNGEGEDRRP
ncbi:DUF3040 domain-containing protein [Pseudonocardia sp. C8]|uniref:DUF3040 domain-containing protein n=1 Tax=Pseudonocardia sp. C8 TaxID=2762759 RepID=UPI001642ED99|nr:DUF3040 domain-containing protein [Pseudonocardia sp. C8]MBC3191207.1 DUF3040 domain-containing protein [Pseudonocardia sp. C8]